MTILDPVSLLAYLHLSLKWLNKRNAKKTYNLGDMDELRVEMVWFPRSWWMILMSCMTDVRDMSICFVPRQCNMVVHQAAHYAVSLVNSVFWFDRAPYWPILTWTLLFPLFSWMNIFLVIILIFVVDTWWCTFIVILKLWMMFH